MYGVAICRRSTSSDGCGGDRWVKVFKGYGEQVSEEHV